jgi:DNA-binding XRE family transcriptional regulator
MKSQNHNETIGDKIKQLRNKQSLTQDELTRKSDLPYTTLTKIESNVITKPTIQTVIKIAKGLSISIDDLIISRVK